MGDGQDPVQAVSRFGRVTLYRQVLFVKERGQHVMPGNTVLPAHSGVIITRGVQEMACLFSLDLPFASVERLLNWETQEEALLSATTYRTLVRSHGQVIRQAEAAEAEALWAQDAWETLTPQLVAATEPRRAASWPAELTQAVEAALAADALDPPAGIAHADWERVLEARRHEQQRQAEPLRRLGPQLAETEVMATADEVLTRKPQKRRFWELRTARVATRDGYRYLSGTGESFLLQLAVLLLVLGVGRQRSLLFLADGARWIRNFYDRALSHLPQTQMILDWYHLRHKLSQLASLICRGKPAKTQFLRTLATHLWRGEVEAALAFLEAYRPQAKREAALDELITYLQDRTTCIPNYKQRRQERRYIGSGQGEKANDLIVARRQKHKGMHWSLETSDALAALKTLMLNGGWELYWQHRQVLPLAA